MGRISIKKNKNIYHVRREELGLSREKASEVLGTIPAERIEKIENERTLAHPDEILAMANGYKMPTLCNHYCSNECPIGQRYVPEITIKNLSQIVLEMLASLNSMKKKQERLIEITANGIIEEKEIEDFFNIQQELERISVTVETLQLWTEQMIANNTINHDLYDKIKKEKR